MRGLFFLILISCGSSQPKGATHEPEADAASIEPDLSERRADGVPSMCARWGEFMRACVADQEMGLRLDIDRTLGLHETQWREEAVDDESTRELNKACSEYLLHDKKSMAGLCPELVGD